MEGQQAHAEFKLLGDQPSIAGDDVLGFGEIAEGLAQLILTSARSTPFTLGIEGGWGQGKSSLMGRIESALREAGKVAEESGDGGGESRVKTVRFNAWTAGDGDVLEGLVKSVLAELDESVLRKLAHRKRLISWVRFGFTLIAHWLRLGSIVDRLWTELDVDPKARNQMRDLLADAFEEWRGSDPELSHRRLLVVFVDDLDRCTPQNVFQVFEAMKLYLDAPGLAFVVGFDAGIVSDAILEEKGFSDELKGQHYLEKVIQTRYRIPPTGDRQAQALIESCMDASGTRNVFDKTAQRLVVERNARNPRRIKRFINSFIIKYQIGDGWEKLDAKTLIRVLIVDFYFSDFAQLLYDTPDDDKRNPIRDFLDYVTVRDLLRQSKLTLSDSDTVTQTLESYDFEAPHVDAGESARAKSLAELEQALPDVMSRLADDRPFVRLIREIRMGADPQDLQNALRRAALDVPDDPPGWSLWQTSLSGLHVLWLTDDETGDFGQMQRLQDEGVAVSLVHDLEAARAQLRQLRPDALISDVTRGEDSERGLSDIQAIRAEEGLYDGPVLLFTARVTPARRTATEALDADVTSAWSDVFAFLRGLRDERSLSERDPARRSVRGEPRTRV